MNFQETSDFKKDFKKLVKKYQTLQKDFDELKEFYLANLPQGNGTKHWNLLHQSKNLEIYKMRMQCDSTKGKSFRIIYAYKKETETIEMIEFIEIYFKGNKESEDKSRIKVYVKLNVF